ncbi:hypothetical protein N0V82_006664 [Gnomoniopsis sp. IMI 355080]|nr:hypothetical protein N0V82_006664 [Gnomoniopsis sp. IMI 355080]
MSQNESQNVDAKPLSFGVVLFPGFQALDVFGPLDALNILSTFYKMNLYILAETLEPVSTRPLVEKLGSNFGESILPTHTFTTAPPLDVLLVPGGRGTRVSGIASAVGFVRDVFPSLRYLITVCTGAGIAARAGVLDGRRATTNKLAWEETIALGPKVRWVHRARWVEDGNVWTSSGISAGIDVTFAWMRAVYGEEIAKIIADRMEYTPIMDPDNDPFADRWGAKA